MQTASISPLKKRIEFIDFAKTIGIILVVLGHVYRKPDSIYNFIYSFHVPLFFLLSGVFVNFKKNSSIKILLLNRFKNLIIPYLFFYLLTYLYWIIIESRFRGDAGGIDIVWWKPLIGIFYGSNESHFMEHNTPLWFIPCLISTEIISFQISKYKSMITQLLLVGCCVVLGFFIFRKLGFLLPWGVGNAAIAIVFFYTGKYIKRLSSIKIVYKLFLFLLITAIYILFIYEDVPKSDLFIVSFENKFLFLLIAFYTIIMVLLFSDLFFYKMSAFWKELLSFFGLNTLIILCIHDPVKRVVIYVYSIVFEKTVAAVRTNIFDSMICVFIVMVLMIPSIIIYNKFIKEKLTNLFNNFI